MRARSTGILLAVMLLAAVADAGWWSGDRDQKKLPTAIKMAEIRKYDAGRLARPDKVFSRNDRRFDEPAWGGPGPVFYRPAQMRVSHQHKY